MEEIEQNKTFFELCENLLVKPIKMSSRLKINLKNNILFNDYGISGVHLKNKICFLNLTDNAFCDKNGIPTDDYFEFYKKIASSGVGLIVTGGAYAGLNLFSLKGKCNYSKIGYTTEENDIYSAFTTLIHTFGTKVFFKIKTIFGRADEKNGVFCNFSRTASKIRCYNNSLLPSIKLSDGKCDKLAQEILKIAKFSMENDFDGLVLDASLFGLLGEFSSCELNTRKLGYYSERKDFLVKILTKFKNAGIRKNIFLEFSFSSFCKEVFGSETSKIKTIKNFNKNCSDKANFEFLVSLVKLGIDGFIFKLGTYETEFLSVFNEFEAENMLEKFYVALNEYLEENKVINKYGERVTIVRHDNFNMLSNISKNCTENTLFDITKHILSNENYLNEIEVEEESKRCIKCSICDKASKNENRVTCAINPSICHFEPDREITPESIAVIGAGVAGINCALELAKRHHKVDLFEISKTLNPHGRAMEIFGYNQPLKNYNDYLENQINKLAAEKKITLHLGEKFDTATTKYDCYDTIIVSTGFNEKFLGISGAVLNNVKNIYEALADAQSFDDKKNIVIDAKSEIAFELAIYLLLEGKFVSLIISNLSSLKSISNDKLTYFLYALKRLGCKVYVQAKVKRIEADFVELLINDKLSTKNFVSDILNAKSKNYFKLEQKAKSIDCDQFIYEPEICPNCRVFYELVQKNYQGKLYMIGNALQNSNLENDIKTAFFVAKNI